MTQWWNGLNDLQQLFYYCAIPATVVLFIQTLLTILGLGNDVDVDSDLDIGFDSDFDGDTTITELDLDQVESTASLKFFSIRGIVAFLTLFGWVGVVLSDTNLHTAIIFLIATLSGLAGMLIIALMFYGITRLQSSGNIRLNNAIGSTAQVYIPIPPSRSGKGKIQVTIQERLSEVYAMSESKKTLSTGCIVRVVDVIDINTLLVEKTR